MAYPNGSANSATPGVTVAAMAAMKTMRMKKRVFCFTFLCEDFALKTR